MLKFVRVNKYLEILRREVCVANMSAITLPGTCELGTN